MGLIVLADDDDDLRAVYAPMLRSMGHDVREAVGGVEALDLIRRHPPDLLILDVWMPGCTPGSNASRWGRPTTWSKDSL